MDVLAGYQHRGRASLDQTAVLLGFPGKLGMSGDKVWNTWLAGGIDEIRIWDHVRTHAEILADMNAEVLSAPGLSH